MYYIKTSARPPFPNPIIILDNENINKSSPPSFYANVVIEDEDIEDTKNKGDLKDL